MFCKQCGQKNDQEDKFCRNCGASLQETKDEKSNIFKAKKSKPVLLIGYNDDCTSTRRVSLNETSGYTLDISLVNSS